MQRRIVIISDTHLCRHVGVSPECVLPRQRHPTRDRHSCRVMRGGLRRPSDVVCRGGALPRAQTDVTVSGRRRRRR